jgi:hypothetical protein
MKTVEGLIKAACSDIELGIITANNVLLLKALDELNKAINAIDKGGDLNTLVKEDKPHA